MDKLDAIGSDIGRFACPRCGSSDRERHLYLFLHHLGLWDKFTGANVLHFAPERMLSKIISAKNPALWIRADLFSADPTVEKIDVQNIPYGEDFFDVVIANHVLEHVADDRAALQELYRVLKPTGLAILQTPYSAVLEKTFCDPGINTEEARYQAYGQADHVRLFGRDLFARIESIGFVSRVVTHGAVLGDCDPEYWGVNSKEPFFLFQKPGLKSGA